MKLERCIMTGLALITAVFVALKLWLIFWHGSPGHSCAAIASTAFVAMGIFGRRLQTAYARRLVLALMACWLGDVLGAWNFIHGLAAFLAAHLILLTAFWAQGLNWWKLLRFSGPVLVTAMAVIFWLFPHVPSSEYAPVSLYILAITLMLLFAFAAAQAPGGAIALIGAVVFFISDVFVARWRYVSSSDINALFCYPLYYSACVLFALSAWRQTRPSSFSSPVLED
jgi:uncharacterized membrane protein YhhN